MVEKKTITSAKRKQKTKQNHISSY